MMDLNFDWHQFWHLLMQAGAISCVMGLMAWAAGRTGWAQRMARRRSNRGPFISQDKRQNPRIAMTLLLGGIVSPLALGYFMVRYGPTRVLSVNYIAAGIAIVLGPLLGSYIVSITTWRWVFYINLPFGILAMIVLLFAVGPLRPQVPGGFDVPGAALLSGWVAALMLALVQVADAGWAWTDPRTVGLLAAALVLVAIFMWWEFRVKEPLVPFRLLKERVIAACSGAMFFSGVVFSSLITFLSVFVGIVLLHGGPNAAGDVRDIIYFLAVPLILGAAISGQILSRVSYRNVVVPGLIVATIAAFFLTVLTPSSPLWVLAFGFLPVGGIALPLIPMGFGLGLGLAGTTIAVQNEAPPAEVGAAIGLTRFLQSLGGALGISLLTVFQAWRYGVLSAGATTPTALANALTTSYDQVFLVIAVSILLSLIFALFLTGRVPPTPTRNRGSSGSAPVAVATAEAAASPLVR